MSGTGHEVRNATETKIPTSNGLMPTLYPSGIQDKMLSFMGAVTVCITECHCLKDSRSLSQFMTF